LKELQSIEPVGQVLSGAAGSNSFAFKPILPQFYGVGESGDKSNFDEEKILALLSQGSEYAFTQIFDHYRGRIYGVAMKFLHDQEMAEEVVQEVF
jgi:hypothetical protein